MRWSYLFAFLSVRWRLAGVVGLWISNYFSFHFGWGIPCCWWSSIHHILDILLPTPQVQVCWDCKLKQRGSAMAQVVSCQRLATETLVKCQASPCGICSGRSGTGTGLPASSSVFSLPVSFHQDTIIIFMLHLPEADAGEAGEPSKKTMFFR